jgi:hypothetical protein
VTCNSESGFHLARGLDVSHHSLERFLVRVLVEERFRHILAINLKTQVELTVSSLGIMLDCVACKLTVNIVMPPRAKSILPRTNRHLPPFPSQSVLTRIILFNLIRCQFPVTIARQQYPGLEPLVTDLLFPCFSLPNTAFDHTQTQTRENQVFQHSIYFCIFFLFSDAFVTGIQQKLHLKKSNLLTFF